MWLDTVRIARNLGDVSTLLPRGITSLADCPYHIHDAISKALVFLSFGEELAPEERPPKHIWLDPEALKEHFDKVKKMRDEKFGMDKDGPGPIEDPVQNDAASKLVTE